MRREQGISDACLLAPLIRVLPGVAVAVGVLLGSPAAGVSPAAAGDNLVIAAGIKDKQQNADLVRRFRAAGHDAAVLDTSVLDAANRLLADIDRGQIDETGARRPAHLADFSKAILDAVPGLFEYKRVHMVSPVMVPVELVVGGGGEFAGDRIVISHEFSGAGRSLQVPREVRRPLASYVVEAVIGMPAGSARAGQDIVQVALARESRHRVELNLGGGRGSMERALARNDIGILHIDTHGDEGGRAIQIARSGAMLEATAVPARVRVPVVLLFGCEGTANALAFGSVLRQRGAEAVISSVAKFESFGLTGDPAREQRIYEAFFAAIDAGEDVGTALLGVRQAARTAAPAETGRTLTRLFFVLLGNGRLRLDPAQAAN